MDETAKVLKFKKKANEESDEDFKAEAEAASKKIADVNETNKKNIQVYQGKIKSAVEECCKSHNASVMAIDSKKHEAMIKQLASPLPKQLPQKRRLITDAADEVDEVNYH